MNLPTRNIVKYDVKMHVKIDIVYCFYNTNFILFCEGKEKQQSISLRNVFRLNEGKCCIGGRGWLLRFYLF